MLLPKQIMQRSGLTRRTVFHALKFGMMEGSIGKQGRRYFVKFPETPSARHWKATMEYHKTKDILHVKQILGHKNINNTLIYVTIDNAIFQNATEEFHVKTAKTVEEACKLVEVGFEYVTDIEGIKIFRKRK